MHATTAPTDDDRKSAKRAARARRPEARTDASGARVRRFGLGTAREPGYGGPMHARAITGAEFPKAIEDGIVLVDFWATWCGPCRAFAPIFERSAAAHPDVAFLKIDTDAESELAGALQVQSIPTVMAFRDGVLLFRHAGLVPEEGLRSLIEQIRGIDMDEVRAKLAAADAAGGGGGGEDPQA